MMAAAHGTRHRAVISKGAVAELTDEMATPTVGLTILQQAAVVAAAHRQGDERQIPRDPQRLGAALL